MSGILLDTHVWIWLNNGSPELKSAAIREIDHASQNGELFISAISVWEIGMLESRKRILLRVPIQEWINQALSQPGVELIPLSPHIAIESSRLPGELHGDPADRIIIATARIQSLTVMTRDLNIQQYAKAGFVLVKKV